MKRFLAATLVLSMFSVCTLVGCSEESKEKTTVTKDTPGGSVKETTEKKTEATGDQKPVAETPK